MDAMDPSTDRPAGRLPRWLTVRAPGGARYRHVAGTLRSLDLSTVCQEAACPNRGECWGAGTATVMLLGDVCTRGCRFCAVASARQGRPVDLDEPRKVAEAVAELGLDYVVLTTVDRDDLPDGGAAHLARTVRAILEANARVRVELLVGDLSGDEAAVAEVAGCGAAVLAHNVEVVRRLTPQVRDPRCGYDLSLSVLRRLAELAPAGVPTKSSLMVGLGETPAEVTECLEDLRAAGVELLTIGQYLRPSKGHLPVEEYVPPARFEAYRDEALQLGFSGVASGPLVRSSYRAAELR